MVLNRSAAPSQIGLKYQPVKPSSAHKRKSHDSDDDDEENTRPNAETSNQWAKFAAHLKKHKNKAHDNYDATNFVSQFRKPLAIMPADASNSPRAALAAPSAPLDALGKSHVRDLSIV